MNDVNWCQAPPLLFRDLPQLHELNRAIIISCYNRFLCHHPFPVTTQAWKITRSPTETESATKGALTNGNKREKFITKFCPEAIDKKSTKSGSSYEALGTSSLICQLYFTSVAVVARSSLVFFGASFRCFVYHVVVVVFSVCFSGLFRVQ